MIMDTKLSYFYKENDFCEGNRMLHALAHCVDTSPPGPLSNKRGGGWAAMCGRTFSHAGREYRILINDF
jgi:hypothetical protein